MFESTRSPVAVLALLLAVGVGCTAPGPAGAGPENVLPAASRELRLPDVHGALHQPLAGAPGEVVAIVFVSVDCPIASATMPEIRRVQAELVAGGGRLYLVHGRAGQGAAGAASHAADFELTMPVLLDEQQALVTALDARVTPEAFVLVGGVAGEMAVVYRGRIDDLYADLGRRRAVATSHDLRRAVAAALAGDPVEPASVPALGCHIERIR